MPHLHLENFQAMLDISSPMSQRVTGRLLLSKLTGTIAIPVGIIILVIVAGPV